MSRRDLIHKQVRKALQNDGWKITHDPLKVEIDLDAPALEIDLAAERIITAEKSGEKIAVEVKSFISSSIVNAFHTALGQYLDYQDAMEESGIQRVLYLAIREETYDEMLRIKFVMKQIRKYGLNLIVVNIQKQIIVQWL